MSNLFSKEINYDVLKDRKMNEWYVIFPELATNEGFVLGFRYSGESLDYDEIDHSQKQDFEFDLQTYLQRFKVNHKQHFYIGPFTKKTEYVHVYWVEGKRSAYR